jgi:hypothetical protein
MPLSYHGIDFDNHCFEPDDCFTRHISPKFREHAIHVVSSKGKDLAQWALGDRIYRNSHQVADQLMEPGSLEDLFAGKASLTNKVPLYRPRDRREFVDRRDLDLRLRLMAEHSSQEPATLEAFDVHWPRIDTRGGFGQEAKEQNDVFHIVG